MAQIVQKNFAAGEVSPDIEVRNDFVSNQTGLRSCRNSYIRRQGGLSRRYGSKFVGEVGHQSEKKVRLIPFQFTVGDSFVIEMGEGYFRFYKNGALITYDYESIVSVATNTIETTNPHGLGLGDEVYLTLDFDGKKFVKEKFVVTAIPDTTHFEVSNPFLNSVDFSSYGTFNSGEVFLAVEYWNPFSEDELFDVRFTQVGDLMTMVHFNHGIYNMIRYDDENWLFYKNGLTGDAWQPLSLSISKDGSNTGTYSYEFYVSAISENGYESFSIYEKITGVLQLDGINSVRNLTLSIDYDGPNTKYLRIYMREVPYVLAPGYTSKSMAGFGLYDIIEVPPAIIVPLNESYIVDGNLDPDTSKMPLVGEITDIVNPSLNRWKKYASSQQNAWMGITYGAGLFVAVAQNGTNRVMTSPDGITWTNRTASSAQQWRSIAYDGVGMFVAVSSTGMSSPDGINWTTRSMPTNNFQSVTFGGGLFVAVGGSANNLATSPDGITWTSRSISGFNVWNGIAYGAGIYVAVGEGPSAYVMTSPDGINWTDRTPTENNEWTSVSYGNGYFVAVSRTGTNRIMVSPDGINWTPAIDPVGAEWLASTFADGRFVVVGNNYAMMSENGLTWVVMNEASGVWNGVAFGDNKFVAVSYTGSDRVMVYDLDTPETVELKPIAVSVSKERQWYGGSLEKPGQAWGSKVGYYNDFKQRYETSIVASDPVKANTPSENMGKIMHLLDYKRLFAFTDTSEVVFKGIGENGAISATDLPNPEKISENGISRLRPLIVDKSVLYVQARGSIIRDMMAEITLDSYPGDEISLFSAHLVDNYELVDWAFQKTPHPIVWIARNDGVMLSITYNATQQIKGFARHDFLGGVVESMACVSEAQYDVLYVVVKRTINGFTKRYIETIVTKEPVPLAEKTFMDSYLTYDGRNTDQDHNMRVGTFTDYNFGTALRLQSLEDYFDSSHVGKYIFMYRDGEVLRLRIDSIVDGFEAVAYANKNVPAEFQATGMASWALAVDTVSGLSHLEGEDVCVLADGNVVGSPLNEDYATITVTNGEVTLDVPAAVIHVGLPYVTDIEPLDFDTAERLNSMADKPLLTNRFNARVLKTSSFFAGGKEPTGDNYLQGLNEVKVREYEGYDEANELKTGLAEVAIESSYEIGGRVFIRQVDPLPLNILSIFPDTQTN